MTQPIRYYPSYEHGLDSTDFRARNRIIYSFRTEQACRQFVRQIAEWGRTRQLTQGTLSMRSVKPFETECSPFYARPEIVAYLAIIDFPTSINLPHEFARTVNYLGIKTD